MKDNEHLGIFIRKARLKSKITQRYLSRKLGCTSQFIANWERGASRPPLNYLRKIQKTLKIPEEQFISFLVKESLIPYKNIFK